MAECSEECSEDFRRACGVAGGIFGGLSEEAGPRRTRSKIFQGSFWGGWGRSIQGGVVRGTFGGLSEEIVPIGGMFGGLSEGFFGAAGVMFGGLSEEVGPRRTRSEDFRRVSGEVVP